MFTYLNIVDCYSIDVRLIVCICLTQCRTPVCVNRSWIAWNTYTKICRWYVNRISFTYRHMLMIYESYAIDMRIVCKPYANRMWIVCDLYTIYMQHIASSSSIFLIFPPVFMLISFSLNCFMKLISLIDKNVMWSPPPFPTVKPVCEVSIAHIRCVYNIHMICILTTYDPHMIRILFAYYSHTHMCKSYVMCILITYFRM